MTPVKPAKRRIFKVLWFEVRDERTVLVPGQGRKPLPKPLARRRKTLEIKARTLDVARRLAREAVEAHGVTVISVNFTRTSDQLVVYSKEAR